jgi:CRP/FNR family transcriptional regulator, cyclic AMP receptor protein
MSPFLKLLTESGVSRTYKKNSLLIREGEQGDQIFIILSGRVRAFSSDLYDKEIIHGVYGPGEYFGELSLDGGMRSASVETLEPTVCSLVSRQTLRAFIQAYPDFAFELIGKLIQRIRAATDKSTDLALSDVYCRLVKFLGDALQLAVTEGLTSARRISHQEIASHIGCSREMVSKIMKDLEAGNYLRTENRKILLLKPLPSQW